MTELSARQAAFVREYCVDSNGTQAAIRAGYSKRTAQEQASRLLSNAMVKGAVDAALSKLAAKTGADAEWVLRRLKEEAEDFSEGASAASRVRAIELVGRHLKMFTDKTEHTGADGNPVKVTQRLIVRFVTPGEADNN
jgi:phage terminase small subunit